MKVVLIVIALVSSHHLTEAVTCYSCNSLDDIRCLDPWISASSGVARCTGNYCYKSKGEIPQGK